ncbi:TrlF family AAA-like ATPase [Coprococcus comes]|uniref:TrlF family AAA-like ATPase n=1 Tax=Coprococcus comes TaxID=410072 RepID=UPI001899581E|nr:hypothetical protein [Coprococcus comes]
MVSVIGITDYLSIQNYLKVKNDNRLPETVKMVLPNVEMRLTLTASEAPVNIHFLFDPKIVDDLETRFFGKLSFSYAGGCYSATRNELIRFGHTLDQTLEGNQAFKKGAEQYLVELSAVRQLFKNDPELRKHTLIVVANSSTDGASGIGKKGGNSQTDALRKSVYQFADAIFSAQPSDRRYFLGEGVDDFQKVIDLYGSLMPCVHGSDAHSIEKIFEPDQQRYCWIKADTTFEGLLQILYEPAERVVIQSNRPDAKDPHQIIESITFEDNNFQRTPIVFNDSLTCIIGGKSTGKSLLLRQLAQSIDNSYTQKQEKDLTQRTPFKVDKATVLWKDKTSDSRRIVYIPQSFLSRIVDDAEESSEISKIIHDILLQEPNIKEAYKEFQQKQDILDSRVAANINEYCKLTTSIRNLEDEIKKEGHADTFRTTIKSLEAERAQLASVINISDEELDNYTKLEKELRESDSKIEKLSRDLKLLKEMPDPVAVIPGYFRTNDCINIEHLFEKFFESSADDLLNAISESESILCAEWRKKVKTIKESLSNEIKEIECSLREKRTLYEQMKVKVDQNTQLQILSKKITEENKKLTEAEKRNATLSSYYNEANKLKKAIISSQEEYRSICEGYCNVVNETGTKKTTNLTFDAQTVWKKRDFFQSLMNSLNNRNFSNFRNTYHLDLSSPDSIKNYDNILLENLWTAIVEPDKEGGLNIKGAFNLASVLREIFKNWYNIHYIVKSGHDTIEEMSPGKKALVLLEMLISLEDSLCPILIDQPEDDLDNRSIYDDLVNFIREKKHERQIIIVTHNANVVLGADAEEVIIANQMGQDSPNEEYRFEYRSGSIENNELVVRHDGLECIGVLYKKGIQTQICDILEGGRPAFEKRQHKYFSVEHHN